jgi:glycosyltransferase involved in cell wall biosynthesis
MPVYNGGRFLAGALRSMLSQTYTDLELIISDNASTDETKQICERHAAQDARIRYFRQPRNIGLARNWNFVAQQARGEYFKWASANDECARDMLERCIAALDADPGVVLAQGRTCLVDEDTGRRELYADDLALMQDRALERMLYLCDHLKLNNGQCGVIRLPALRETRLDRPYDGGDLILMAELALRGKFVVLPEVLFYRRMGPTTFTHSPAYQGRDELFDKHLLGHRVHWHLDYIRTMALAPLPIGDKARALARGVDRFIKDCPRFWRSLRRRLSLPSRHR